MMSLEDSERAGSKAVSSFADTESSIAELCPMVLEALNTVLVSFALSELLLRKKSWRDLQYVLIILTFLNVLLSERLHSSLSALRPLFQSNDTPEQAQSGNQNNSGDTVQLPNLPESKGHFAGLLPSLPALRGTARVCFILTAFIVVAFFDVRRLRPRPYTFMVFLLELKQAVYLVLPVFPFLVMTFSFIFLIVASLLMKLGLPSELGEELIFYGQFYMPLSAVYWIIKKEWIHEERKSTPLPVSDGPSTEVERPFCRRRAL